MSSFSYSDCDGCPRKLIPSEEVLCVGPYVSCSFECLDRVILAHPIVVERPLIVPPNLHRQFEAWSRAWKIPWTGEITVKAYQ